MAQGINQSPQPGTSLYEATKRRTLAMAEREEIRNRKQKGELVDAKAVASEWFKVARQTRDAMLNIPARISAQLAAEKKQEKCFAILQKEIQQALEGLEKQP